MDKKIIELKNIKNSTKNFFSKEIFKGFTLVELLVVISIVAVIVSVTVVFLGQTRASARDGKRQTEMHTLETTLQQYHSDHGNYPKEETGIIVEEQYQDEAGTFYMEMKDEYLTSSPKDPLYASGKTYVDAEGIDRDYGYRYVTNDNGSEYALFNGLETSGDYIESYSSGSAGETIGWEGVPATPPSPPTGFSSPGHGSDYVNLTWDPNPEPDITGYKIHRGGESGNYTSIINVGNQTNYTVNSLSPNTAYFLALKALNTEGGESGYSAEIMIITDNLASPPSSPTGLFSPDHGSDYVVLAWNPNPESDIAGYKIHYKEGEASIYSELDVGNQTSYVFNGLSSGTRYYFSLTAYDVDAEESNSSGEIMVMTD